MRIVAPLIGLGLLLTAGSANADDPAPRVRVHVDRIVVDDNFPDAYQVEVADINGDGKPDLVALGGKTIAWYENPSWTKRVIATGGDTLKGDIISSATADLDGDGRAEIAIACDFAMNTPTRGQLWLAIPGATWSDPWLLRKVADVPSIHRVRWADLDGDRKPELIVAPLFGPKAAPPTYDQDPARVVEFRPDPADPKVGRWAEREIMRRPVVHAIEVMPARSNPGSRLVGGRITVASNAGLGFATLDPGWDGRAPQWVAFPELAPGAAGPAPKRGCSDVRTLPSPQAPRQPPSFVTIEPWHGSELAFWHEPKAPSLPPLVRNKPEAAAGQVAEVGKTFGELLTGRFEPMKRTVIDDSLDDGHALWTADVDGDGTDEVFAGHRGKDHRVSMYRRDGDAWERTVIDRQIAAQDLRGGDLDGDGVPDIVAVGGSTHNVVWYRPTRLKGEPASIR